MGYLRMGYAGGQVAFETDSAAAGAPTVIYTWGPGVDQLVGVRVGGTDYGVITDPLGSVRALVRRSDGSWAGRLSYAPYGELLDSAGPQPALRYRWTGREWDAETGFYFHRTRYYDPGVRQVRAGGPGRATPGAGTSTATSMGTSSRPGIRRGCCRRKTGTACQITAVASGTLSGMAGLGSPGACLRA